MDDKKIYVGIDIGTTATKAVCFNRSGKVIYEYSKEYPLYHPEFDQSIQKPNEVLVAVLACINQITKEYQPEFISFSSAMQSVLIIDELGNPLTDAIIWADNRAHEFAESLKVTDVGKRFYQKTGIPIHTFSPMTKIAWLKEHKKGVFSKAFKFISLKEYVWHQLTGEYAIDSSMASGTGIMNIHNLEWDLEILKFLDIHSNQLSKIVKPTHFCKGLNDHLLYVIGGGDGALANLGTGAMEPGKVALTIGTSGAVRLPIEKPFIDSQMRTQCYHLIDNQYLTLGAVSNGAIVLQWLKESILKTEDSFETLFKQAANVSSGSDGLLFVPYLLGERAPIWDASAKGTLLGIKIIHTQAHFIRATMEGILFGLLNVLEILLPNEETREQHTIMASGGFAKSEFWLQMTADVFQMKVRIAETVEASAWGAVLIGFKSKEIEVLPETSNGKVFLPNKKHKIIYEQSFTKFKRVYPLLKELE
ncbi:gluconokinase [Flavobacterium sp. WC2416]|uniref:Gluconokinase n=1 Tax=Flavobacterium sp. WC2416 TaxID=3234141 RepID=A0AB39WB55_9FLAO